MGISHAERRQIENEMIFRRVNEKVGDGLDILNAQYLAEGDMDLVKDGDIELHFKCECSDEDCSIRIPMLLTEYREIHTNRDTFIVKPDHQIDAIEKILKITPKYTVVKKNNSTPEPNDTLNDTSVGNS